MPAKSSQQPVPMNAAGRARRLSLGQSRRGHGRSPLLHLPCLRWGGSGRVRFSPALTNLPYSGTVSGTPSAAGKNASSTVGVLPGLEPSCVALVSTKVSPAR